MNKRYLVLSLAAGLLGGVLSNYMRPVAAYAQSQAPQEIRAQRFTLVNEQGVAFGSFAFDHSSHPQIVLRDPSGRDVWKLGGDDLARKNGTAGRFDIK